MRVRVVNKGKVGEPEHIVYQNQETKEIIELDAITDVLRNGEYEEPDVDENLHYVLDNMGHCCDILLNDVGSGRHTLVLE
jgi:hypothetical protein